MLNIAKTKNRKQKHIEYESKYAEIPVNYAERLDYMCDKFNITETKMNEILLKRNNMLSGLQYYDLNIVSLYEEPEGTQRARYRLINKSNFNHEALVNSTFVHVYSPNAKDDSIFMRRLVDDELIALYGMITTPCSIVYNAYYKTPSQFNVVDTFLSEIGILRPPIAKPDWDNVGKKYCDMYNHNVWLDDSQVIDGMVRKFYSILPRVEIQLRYLNCIYNKQLYNNIINRKDCKDIDGNDYTIPFMDNKGEIQL